jgi:outer membrane immunogenic protein
MKKFLLSSVAFLGLTAGAMAADLPSRRFAPAPAPGPMYSAVPVFTWTGFYAGVNAGWGWGTNNNGSVFGLEGSVFNRKDRDSGFVGGGQVGYNMQFGSFVAGVEADLQLADLEGRRGFVNQNGVWYNTGASGLDYFGTVRARLGFAIDRALVYGTGGFAYGGGDNKNSGCFNGTVVVDCGNGDDSSTGWTLGGGVEYAVTNNVTVKVEGLYVNLDRGGDDTFWQTGMYNTHDDLEFGVVRGGLNFKF